MSETVRSMSDEHGTDEAYDQGFRDGVRSLARDVVVLINDYSDSERDMLALMPFTATFDQVLLEKYSIELVWDFDS